MRGHRTLRPERPSLSLNASCTALGHGPMPSSQRNLKWGVSARTAWFPAAQGKNRAIQSKRKPLDNQATNQTPNSDPSVRAGNFVLIKWTHMHNCCWFLSSDAERKVKSSTLKIAASTQHNSHSIHDAPPNIPPTSPSYLNPTHHCLKLHISILIPSQELSWLV